MQCELCAFENPRPSVTAIAIRENSLLVVKRNQEPFQGEWDFIGGYMQKNETPEAALKREIKEELGVESSLVYIGSFTGTASYKDHRFPVITFAHLVELQGEIKLNEENSAIAWVSLAELNSIAFDSNQKILSFLKQRWIYDIVRVRELVKQLDPSTEVNEQSLYRATLNGYVSIVSEGEKLIGLGWIFPRQTLLRKQAVVEDMIVDNTYRGRGLGEKILHDLLRWAKEQSIEMVELTTNPRRVAANALYQKVGFKLHETNHYLLDLLTYRPLAQ